MVDSETQAGRQGKAKGGCCCSNTGSAEVEEADRESFPASDPPAWTLGHEAQAPSCCGGNKQHVRASEEDEGKPKRAA